MNSLAVKMTKCYPIPSTRLLWLCSWTISWRRGTSDIPQKRRACWWAAPRQEIKGEPRSTFRSTVQSLFASPAVNNYKSACSRPPFMRREKGSVVVLRATDFCRILPRNDLNSSTRPLMAPSIQYTSWRFLGKSVCTLTYVIITHHFPS